MPEPDVQPLTFVGADDAASCDPVTGVCEVPASAGAVSGDDRGANDSWGEELRAQ